jgi:hypothetical protein
MRKIWSQGDHNERPTPRLTNSKLGINVLDGISIYFDQSTGGGGGGDYFVFKLHMKHTPLWLKI